MGALEAEGSTIAVLGSGFEHIFPKENLFLFHKIIQMGGAIITEYEPDTPIRSEYFLERNRIVSGMSMGTLVVEAKFRSGTSVTAALARQQGRKVFCYSSGTEDKYHTGTYRLLKEGKAILATQPEDILKCYPFLNEEVRTKKEIKEKTKKQIAEKKQTKEQITIQIKNNIFQRLLKQVQDERQKDILNVLQNGSKSSDEIARNLQKPIGEINACLTIMEMEVWIEKKANGKYRIKDA